jgi:hypothetical protein
MNFTTTATNRGDPAMPKKPLLQPIPETEIPATAVAAIPEDPFDLSNLRLPQDFTQTAGVKKLLKTVPVHKPNPQDFCRVNPSPDYRDNFPVIELKDEREEYVIAKALLPELVGEFTMKTLFTAVNRQKVVFLWPVRLPDPEGRQNEWWRSMREAAELAMAKWIRVKSNMSLGAYEIYVADGTMTEPTWPEVSFQELIKIAFRDRLITTMDHPVIKRLRGTA